MLCCDRDETVNRLISKCSKKVQKEFKTRQDWVGKVTPWELRQKMKFDHREMCKKYKFDHTKKLYMHSPASVLENDTHKLICDFEIKTIIYSRPDNQTLWYSRKIENLQNCSPCCPSGLVSKIERMQKEGKIPWPCLGNGKKLEHESEPYTNCNWCLWYSHQGIGTRTGGLGNNGTGSDCPNYCIVMVIILGKNIKTRENLLSLKLKRKIIGITRIGV